MNFDSIERLIGVSSPWIVHDLKINDSSNRIEVCVGLARTGWFGAKRAVQNFSGHHQSWRHQNLAGMRCSVRVDFPENGILPDAPWCGERQAPFSNALGHQVIQLLGEGLPLGTIARILELDADQLWQFKHGLDTGKLSGNLRRYARQKDATAATDHAVDNSDSTGLPPIDSQVWHRILSGQADLDLRNLGLKILMMRLRQQYALAQDEDVRFLKVQQLRRYFEKNARSASHEIRQLMEAAQ